MARWLFVAAWCLVISACGAEGKQDSAITVYESMTEVVIPESELIWGLSGLLWSDTGTIDGSLLNDQQWHQIGLAAVALENSGQALAEPGRIIAAPAGVKIMNEEFEGAASVQDVQSLIDSDPEGFRAEAQAMVAIAQALSAAVASRDGEALDQASGELSVVCGDCHQRFWTVSP